MIIKGDVHPSIFQIFKSPWKKAAIFLTTCGQSYTAPQSLTNLPRTAVTVWTNKDSVSVKHF